MALTKAKLEELITAGDVDPLVTLLAAKQDKLTLLWTNPSPSSTFGAQTVSLALTDYDYIVVFACAANTSDAFRANLTDSGRIIKGETATIWPVPTAGSTNRYSRNVTAVSNSGVTFGAGYANTTSSTTSAVPMYIYGGKF